MVPEARVEETEQGLAPSGPGWFVANARELRWRERPGRGRQLPLTGWSREEVQEHFPQLGVAIVVVQPGEPTTMYHAEDDQEDFLVLAGEAIAVIEGQERRLRQWDFVHCPPRTRHAFVGAGDSPCTILAVGARQRRTVVYPVDEAALRHGAGVERETTDPHEAYARFPDGRPVRYGGWLPG